MEPKTIDVISRCQTLSMTFPDVPEIVTRFADVKVHYQHTGAKVSMLPIISSSAEAEQYLRRSFPPGQIALVEHFYFLMLNRANRLIAVIKHSQGSSAATLCDTKVILLHLIAFNCPTLIICHNHPSGNMRPSMEDIRMTQNIKHACALLDARLADHIILSPEEGEYYSFADMGNL